MRISRTGLFPRDTQGRAEAALAAEGDESLEVAFGTAQACEAALEEAAVEVPPKLGLEENGIAVAVALAWFLEEGFEVVADDGMENGFLGLAPTVETAAGYERRVGGARMGLVLDPGGRCMRQAVDFDHIRRTGSGSVPACQLARRCRNEAESRSAHT